VPHESPGRAVELLGVDPSDRSTIVFVDDVAQNVDVARSSGWRAVHAARGHPWHNDVAALLELPPRSTNERAGDSRL
jgi:FMN phosphatase YigB (HAD superfamily)